MVGDKAKISMALKTTRGARRSLDPYPKKYGPQDIKKNFARNMNRNCSKTKAKKISKKKFKYKKR